MVLQIKLDPGVSLHKDFSLQADKVALLVVDVQEYVWLANTAHDHFCNTYHQGLEKITALAKEFRRVRDDENTIQGGEVVFGYYQSLTSNRRDVSLDLKLSEDRFSMIPGPDAPNLFLEQCKPDKTFGKGDITMPKTSTSLFQSTNIDYVLRNLGIEQLVITGLLTDQGVEAAARDAADLGYFVSVVRDACTAQTMEQHESGLRNMKLHARVLDAHDIVQELRLDFATRKARAAGTSVLETSATDKEAAIAVIQYLKANGFDRAADMAEAHFVGPQHTIGTSEAVGILVSVGENVNEDPSERDPQMNHSDSSFSPAAAEEIPPKEVEGSSSSFLCIDNDVSLHMRAKLADECEVEEQKQIPDREEDRKMPPNDFGANVADETAQCETTNSVDEMVQQKINVSGQSQVPSAELTAMGNEMPIHSVVASTSDEMKGVAGVTAKKLYDSDPNDSKAGFATNVAGYPHKDTADEEPKINDKSIGGETTLKTKDAKPHIADDNDEIADGTGTVTHMGDLESGVDGGSMESTSATMARMHFQAGENSADLSEEPMYEHSRNESSSVTSGRSRDPDGSSSRVAVSPRHHRNSSSFSNFGSSSSIPNIELHSAPSSPPVVRPSSAQPGPEVIPEEEESRVSDTSIANRVMGRLHRPRRQQADPPANRFSSQSIIGDPTKKR